MHRFGASMAALVLGLWVTAAPAVGQVQSKCLSGKLKGAGSAAAGQVSCEAKAAAKGVAVDPDCVAKAAAKLQGAFGKAENKDDCIETGDDALAQTLVDDFVQDLAGLLNPPAVICCQGAVACLYTADAASCAAFSGTPGAEGTVCDGTGQCSAPPATAGSCCQDFTSSGQPVGCANGAFDASACNMAGGTFSTGICTKSGKCL